MQDQSLAASRVRFGPFELDFHSGELRKGPTRLKVPDQSIQVLKALLDAPGQLVTREQLQQRLWPSNTFVDFEHGLNVAIRRLREALGDSADEPKYIETLPRRGYRFVGPIDAVHVQSPIGPRSARRRIRRWQLVTLAALVLVMMIAFMFSYRGGSRSAQRIPGSIVRVTSLPGTEADPALSPDGASIAFAWQGENSDSFDLLVKLIDGGEPLQLTTGTARNRSPKWSPDGHRIAFLSGRPGDTNVVIIPALGGAERRITHTITAPASGLAWTPDGNSLVIVDRGAGPTPSLFLCSIESGERRPLTHPTADFTDGSPAVSPDGQYVAFVRRIAGFTDGRVFVQRLDGVQSVGEPWPLTTDYATTSLDWAPDSSNVFYDLQGRLGTGLWRVSVTGGEPVAVLTNVHATHPSVARDGSRLVYSRGAANENVWAISGLQPGKPGEPPNHPTRVIDSTANDRSPQLSAQGDRVAFASDRTGPTEIWVANRDGSRPMQVTTLGAVAGSPRWSFDGTSLAFDSMHTGSWNIYTVGSYSGVITPITRGPSNNARASWSRDGKWIYFGSNRGGDWQIWKAPAHGGQPTQITKHGGLEAFESPDGKHLYYVKWRPPQGIWQVPVEGGNEVRIIDRGVDGAWGVAETGILIMNQTGALQGTFEFFDFATQWITPIARLSPQTRFDTANPSVTIARDARQVLYVQIDQWGADIEMLKFR